jgi:hypothetical protein
MAKTASRIREDTEAATIPAGTHVRRAAQKMVSFMLPPADGLPMRLEEERKRG